VTDGLTVTAPADAAAPAMPPDGALAVEPAPAVSILDPRALQILSAEHSSLQSARSLAYNEAFTRAGMFLAFLSFSFVGLALVAQALPIDRNFLLVATLVLAFDFVVGLTTYGRIIGTSHEDYLAVHGMARIRHGYGEIAPVVVPYFTTSVHDDLAGVMVSYGSPPTSGLGAAVYQLKTSGTMIGLIVAMIGGVLALVVSVVVGAATGTAFAIGAVAALGVFVALAAVTIRFYFGVQAALPVLYPTPPDSGPGRAPGE
jgi:hypothetical protein